MTKREILLEALASTPADISRLVRSLEATLPDREPDTLKSPQDIVIQLIDHENSFQVRLARLLSENEPHLPHTPSNRSVKDQIPPIGELGRQFKEARQLTIGSLSVLDPKAWQRGVYLESEERITLRFLVQRLIEHDIDCTNQLVEFSQSFRAGKSADRNLHLSS